MSDNLFHHFLLELQLKISEAVAAGIADGIKKIQQREILQPSEYLSRKEAAKLLGISLPTLDSYVKSGLIPSHRLGSTIRFIRSEVENVFIKRKFK